MPTNLFSPDFCMKKIGQLVVNVATRCRFSEGSKVASLSDSHKGGDTSKAIQWLLHMGCTGIYRSEGEQSTFAVVRHTQPMIHDQ